VDVRRRNTAQHLSLSGSEIAVGFNDSKSIDAYSGKDLTYLYSPDTKFADNGNPDTVCWSEDGKCLYGGGSFQTGGFFPICKWSNEGEGGVRRINGIRHSIVDLLSSIAMSTIGDEQDRWTTAITAAVLLCCDEKGKDYGCLRR
jgi:hypothetical protein